MFSGFTSCSEKGLIIERKKYVKKGGRLRSKYISIIVLGAISILGSTNSAGAGIKKCQDEDGKWHYGDFADEACAARADVTKLSQKGQVIGVDKAPPTQEELEKNEKAKKDAQAKALKKKKQRQKDLSLVQIYGSEEVILSTRDRKLESIDNNLEVTRQLKQGIESDLVELKTRKKSKKVDKLIAEREAAIRSYDDVIQQSLDQRGNLNGKYAEILKDFQDASKRLNSGS